MTVSKNKQLKWIHALSLDPITRLKDEDILEASKEAAQNPYVACGSNGHSAPPVPKRPLDSLSKEQQQLAPGTSKKSRFEGLEAESSGGSGPGGFFFGSVGTSRARPPAPVGQTEGGVGRTVFVGGLHPATTEGELQQLFPEAIGVRHPEGELSRPSPMIACTYFISQL